MLALKSALAAAIAWLIVQPFAGFAHDYPYYAPLGAVVAMSTSILGSLRSSAQSIAAIVAGVGIAVGVRALPMSEPVALALGIGVAVLVAGLPAFGAMGSWVPFATLFELIVGRHDPWDYAAAYAGLTGLGALIGLLVNLALPQLPLTPAAVAQDRLRDELADQLDLLADGLDREEALSEGDWAKLRLELAPQARHVDELVAAAQDARRGNWAARRWAEVADRREEQARALKRLTGCVDEVIDLVGDVRTSVHAADDVAAGLRCSVAQAFRAVATMLRTVEDDQKEPDAPPSAAMQAAEAVADLRREAARASADGDDSYLAAAAIAVSLYRAVDAWS